MYRSFSLGIVVSAALVGSTAWADDLNPPPYRGQPRSTVQEWDFDDDGVNPLQPDGAIPTVAGDFKPFLDAAFPTGAPHPSGFANTNLTYDGVAGGFRNTGTLTRPMTFNIPNWIDQEPFKLLRLQITYQGPAPDTDVFGFLGVSPSAPAVVIPPVARVVGTPPVGSYFYEDWQILPNPDWEQVAIFVPPGTFIDQVVVDTVSVPEPGLCVIAMIVPALLARRSGRRH